MKVNVQICLDGAAGCVRKEEKKTMHSYDYSYFWNTLENLKQIPQIRQMDQYIQHGQVTCLADKICSLRETMKGFAMQIKRLAF